MYLWYERGVFLFARLRLRRRYWKELQKRRPSFMELHIDFFCRMRAGPVSFLFTVKAVDRDGSGGAYSKPARHPWTIRQVIRFNPVTSACWFGSDCFVGTEANCKRWPLDCRLCRGNDIPALPSCRSSVCCVLCPGLVINRNQRATDGPGRRGCFHIRLSLCRYLGVCVPSEIKMWFAAPHTQRNTKSV